jgi:hypothetical protein
VPPEGRSRPGIGGLIVKAIDQCEEWHVSGGPAVHGSVADSALGIAPLPKRQAGRRHFVFGPAIGTFEDQHSLVPSDGDNLLSDQNFRLHIPAVRAFKFVDRKVAARWMLLDNSELYRLAASRARIIHKRVKRHGGVVSSVLDVDLTADLFAGKKSRKFLPAYQSLWPYERPSRKKAH